MGGIYTLRVHALIKANFAFSSAKHLNNNDFYQLLQTISELYSAVTAGMTSFSFL